MKINTNIKINKQNIISNTINGKPIDLSFKNLHTLQQIIEHIPFLKIQNKHNYTIKVTDTIETNQTIQKIVNLNQNSQSTNKYNNLENQLQIVRTIETINHNYMDIQNKKLVYQNQKIDNIVKVKVCPQITSLFLAYNKLTKIDRFIEMIEPIFPNLCTNLMWIDLAHNRLCQLHADLGQIKNLKTLYLHANYISNFTQLDKIKKANQLRSLTIHANPLENYGEFRIVILSILPTLKKIDSTLLTKRQFQRAQILMKQLKKYPIIKNTKKFPVESDNQEEDENF